jgi:hypothetical protein
LIVLAVIAVALLQGGTLRNFADVRLRALPLVFGSLALQLLIFTPFTAQPLIPLATEAIYILSMAVLVAWVWLNRGMPGIVLVAAGLLMNTAAIVANNGLMPVAPMAAEYAGRLAQYPTEGAPVANNSIAVAEGVRLWFLTDIFPIPAGIPLATVISLGDILLTIGVSIFCYQVIRGATGAAATPARAVASQEPAKTGA